MTDVGAADRRATLISLLLKGLQLSTGLATLVVLAALLGPAELGRYAYAFAWIQVLHIAAMAGFQRLTVREVAVTSGAGDRGRLRTLLRWAFAVPLVMAGIPALIGAGARLLGSPGLDPLAVLGIPSLVLLGLLPMALVGIQGGILQGLGQPIRSQLPAIVIRPAVFFMLLGAAVLLPGQMGAEAALAAQIAGASVAVLVGGVWLRPLGQRLAGTAPAGGMREWGRAAGTFLLLTGVTVLMNRLDVLMLGWLRPAAEVGTYALVARAAEMVTLALVAARMPLAPRIARAAAEGDLAALRPRLARYTRMAAGLAVVGVGVYALFGPALLSALDPAYRAGFPALMILAAARAGQVSAGMVTLLLNMTRRAHIPLLAMAIAVGGNAVLNAWWIPLWGLNGAAAATGVSLLALHFGLAAVTWRLLGIAPLGLGIRRSNRRASSG